MAARVLAAMAAGLPNFVSLFPVAYPVWRRYRWSYLVAPLTIDRVEYFSEKEKWFNALTLRSSSLRWDCAKAQPLTFTLDIIMTTSTLIEFEAAFPLDPDSRNYGVEYLAEQLTNELKKYQVTILDQDLWMDCGWAISCAINEVQFNIFFAKYSDDENWELTIEPANQPSFIARLFGKKTTPYLESLKKLTSATFYILNKNEFASSIKICLSNKTEHEVNTPEELAW
ncbi:MAG TPA: hypothetical protein VFF26_14740 [Gallionella sp.]|nr:hypothetical protein [Gallionella sp.]